MAIIAYIHFFLVLHLFSEHLYKCVYHMSKVQACVTYLSTFPIIINLSFLLFFKNDGKYLGHLSLFLTPH